MNPICNSAGLDFLQLVFCSGPVLRSIVCAVIAGAAAGMKRNNFCAGKGGYLALILSALKPVAMNDYIIQATTAPEPIPAGYHTVTPFLVVNEAEQLLDFMRTAFNAEQTYVMKDPRGKLMHATAKIGDSIVMIADATEKMAAMPCMLYLYVHDVDKVYQRAVKAGGLSLREPTDEFYGDRSAGIKDRWSNQWWIATHIEDVDVEEISRRADAFYAKK